MYFWFLIFLVFLYPETGLQAPPTLFLLILLALVLLLLLSNLRSAKAFSFHNRSLPNFAYTYATTFCTIAPWRIFHLSPNWLILINCYHWFWYTAAQAATAAAPAATAAEAAAARRCRPTGHAAACRGRYLATRRYTQMLNTTVFGVPNFINFEFH